MDIIIRNTEESDFPQIIELSKEIYREKTAWTERELSSHLDIFPEGQFVAVEPSSRENNWNVSESYCALGRL